MTSEKLSEEAMQALEAHIPELASGALKRAYYRALTESGKVLVAEDGHLVEVSVDGSKRVLRALPPPTVVAVGTRRVRRLPRP